MSEFEPTNDAAALTVQLLSAYLSNNTVASEDLAGLIRSTKEALTGEPFAEASQEPETFTPAVSVRKSVASPEHIISLIDGRPYKTLKRHLMSHGLTPDTYRSRYNLPASYPMVAPAYADRRREVAQQLGLGRRKLASNAEPADDASSVNDAEVAQASPPSVETKQDSAPVAKKRPGRPPKAKSAATLGKSAAAREPETAASADTTTESAASSGDTAQGKTSSRSKPKRRADASKQSGVSDQSKSAARSRSKAKAKAAETVQPEADNLTASWNSGAEGQAAEPAPRTKRRAKLGMFKTSDRQEAGSVPESEDSKAEVSVDAPAPAKRKRSKRMARGTAPASDPQPDTSSAEHVSDQ